MAVHLTRIYTKTGDDGSTALGDMSRVRKTSTRLVAYADVDEANSAIGVVLALGQPTDEVAALLRSVQNDLFDVGADLCTPVAPDPQYPPLRVTPDYTERLEQACDTYNARLAEALQLPAPRRHARRRAAARRPHGDPARGAERVGAARRGARHDPREPALYLNRLSDLLFILSRVANPGGDVMWQPGGGRRP